MVKKCIYCKKEIVNERVADICDRCGIGVWGEKMFKAIIFGMEKEKEKGNMELGRVGEIKIEQKIKNSEIGMNIDKLNGIIEERIICEDIDYLVEQPEIQRKVDF